MVILQQRLLMQVIKMIKPKSYFILEYHLQKRRTIFRITFLTKDTEPSSLNILEAKTNNCSVPELKRLYIKH